MPSVVNRRLPEQLTFWNTWHRDRGATGEDPVQLRTRERFLRELPRRFGLRVLDVGCGQGHDQRAMARAGHRVAGIDFSPVAIVHARTVVPRCGPLRLRKPDLRVHNIAERLPFADGSFDGVYSHLALHYFEHDVTEFAFAEIWRVLRPRAVFVFAVKSTADPYYAKGEQLGQHIFARKGHVRHFFDEDYIRKLLEKWTLISTETYEGKYASAEPSAFIRTVARKSGEPGGRSRS